MRKRQLTAVACRNVCVSKSTDIGGTHMQWAIPREVLANFAEGTKDVLTPVWDDDDTILG